MEKIIDVSTDIHFHIDKWEPPPEVQEMIDKTATSVIEALREFEQEVISKSNGDENNES